MEIHEIILQQLGGRRFTVMTGSKNFIFAKESEEHPNPWLRMNLARNSSKCNRLKIYYNTGLDTYTMEFYKQTISKKDFDVKITHKEVFENVYCDQLQEIFTQKTGLYTSL